MFGGTAFFIGLAAFFFFVYSRLKTSQPIRKSATSVVPTVTTQHPGH
jgi:hypothetical protein